jgi:hypothetical protein
MGLQIMYIDVSVYRIFMPGFTVITYLTIYATRQSTTFNPLKTSVYLSVNAQ